MEKTFFFVTLYLIVWQNNGSVPYGELGNNSFSLAAVSNENTTSLAAKCLF